MVIRKVDGEPYSTPVYFGAKHEGIIVVTLDGQIVIHTLYKDVKITYPTSPSDNTFYIKADKILEC